MENCPAILHVEACVKLWQIAAASVDATNEADKKPVVEIAEHGAQQLAGQLRIPPISVNVHGIMSEVAIRRVHQQYVATISAGPGTWFFTVVCRTNSMFFFSQFFGRDFAIFAMDSGSTMKSPAARVAA